MSCVFSMSKLEFSTSSTIHSQKIFEYIMDFEYYPNYFPLQLNDVKNLNKLLQSSYEGRQLIRLYRINSKGFGQ